MRTKIWRVSSIGAVLISLLFSACGSADAGEDETILDSGIHDSGEKVDAGHEFDGGVETDAGPPEGDIYETVLADLAATCEPGRTIMINGDLPEGFDSFTSFYNYTFTSDCPDTWGENGHWHRGLMRVFSLGDRTQSSQQADPDDDDIIFISYTAADHKWVHNSKTGVRDSNDHHPYSQMVLDEKRDKYYRIRSNAVWIYDIHSDPTGDYEGPEAWTRIDHDFPAGSNSPKEMHELLDRIIMADNNGNVYSVNPDDFADEQVLGTRTGHSGYQSLMTYNRTRGELMWYGGTNSDGLKVTLVDKEGNLIEKADAPESVGRGISRRSLSYDPVSGNYLLISRRHEDEFRVLWEYSPDQDKWEIARNWTTDEEIKGDWPGPYCGNVLIPIDELGVVLWVTRYGPRLYKHESVFSSED